MKVNQLNRGVGRPQKYNRPITTSYKMERELHKKLKSRLRELGYVGVGDYLVQSLGLSNEA